MKTIVVERTDRAFVRVFGKEPLKMVQGLITNDVQNAPENRAVYAGMLTPKGKLLADLRAWRGGWEKLGEAGSSSDVMLECHVDALDNLLGNFKKFVPPLFARYEVVDRLGMTSVHGEDATAVMQKVFPDEQLPKQEDELVRLEGVLCIGSRYTGDVGYDLIGELPERATISQKLVAAGGTFAQLDELDTRRVEAGTPRWGAELDENVIPLEAGIGERMISQGKGCYTGQEVIIRILHRGHVNRHLRRVHLLDLEPPAKGTPLFDPGNGKQIGTLTSAVRSNNGKAVGLAYVRRELLLPGLVALGSVDGPKVEVQA